MRDIVEGDLLWQPSPHDIENANLTRYMTWLKSHIGREFADYQDLWRWSVTDIDAFWASLWDYFDIIASEPYTAVVAERGMPGARWFPGAKLNYAENFFRQQTGDHPALYYQAESGPLTEISWQTLHNQTTRLAQALRAMGVERGDRVVAYLPNIPEAIVGLLATASLGAIWSSCPPDFGDRSVLDRFSQIEPKILIATDGYHWGGKTFDRTEVVAHLQASLPTLEKTILITDVTDGAVLDRLPNTVQWTDLLAATPTADLTFEQVPFDHPLWVLYSSGTTGLPKPIVQGHGGILLEHLKALHLTLDLTPADRFFWFSSTGWMMWNFLVGGLLNGTSIILYNGSPGYPDLNVLWRLAETSGMTYFGASAAFIQACIKAGIHPNQEFDLSRIRAVGSTGSPLPPEGFGWIYDNINADLALESFSGGTDLCTGFIGGIRTQPIYAGELQGPSLGAAVQSFNINGEPVIDEVGELVITEPMPSMPIYFWNDPDMSRYRESYFEMFPGIWRHGDWLKINERHGCVIYGRSDSTINRQGIRMGTSEIYRVVESFPAIADSLIIDLELLGRESAMPLFVVMRDDAVLDDDLQQQIKQKLRSEVSPRHVPNDIIEIKQVPYTLSGKKMEVPIRKILLGMDIKAAANPGAMRNPEALDFFVAYAETLSKE
ncbi:MAG: acetoacetate--CoA ligase [Anaerolineales bacterium]|nr:acetoacetate--CoA ligase [Anaerolineales bacterium]